MIETSSLRRKLLDLAITGKLVPRTGEWKTVRLGEVCDILTGNVFDSRLFTQSGVKICGGLIIAPDRIVWEECKHWTSTEGLEKYELADGDVVVALDRPWISTGAKIGLIHKSDLPCLLIQRTARLRSKEIEPLFLKILLASDDFKNHCVPTGSMLPHISHKDIASFEVSLPPLAEQKAIVKRLDELLALEREIAADSTAVDDLVAAAKRKVLQLAVSGKLIPQQEVWKDAQLGDVCDYGKCIGVDPKELDPKSWVLDLEDIEKDTGRLLVRVSAKDRKSSSTKHAFKQGTLLYSKLRTYLNKVLIAPEDGCCTSEILPLAFDDRVVPSYARIVLMSPMFLDYTAKCCYGVKMPRLGTADGRKGPFPLPPLAEQKAIVAKVDELFSILDAMKGSQK